MSPGGRTLGAGIPAVLTAPQGSETVHLVEIVFSTGTERLSTGTRDIDWNSFTWRAAGGILELGPVEETQALRSQGMEIALSGIDQVIVSDLLNANYRGRSLKVWRAYVSQTTGLIVADPIPLVNHLQLDGYRIEEVQGRGKGSTVTIKTRVALRPSIDERRGIQCNLISHQSLFTTDVFFQHVSTLSGKIINWGSVPVRLGPQGSGGGMSPEESAIAL